MIHKPIHDLQSLDLDKEKRGLKKAKNRRTPEDTDQVNLIKGTIQLEKLQLFIFIITAFFFMLTQLISNSDFQSSDNLNLVLTIKNLFISALFILN